MTMAIEINGLCKSFHGFELQDIGFNLPNGYIMGLIGPNGAGKTTTIKLMLNMVKKKGGEIKLLGLDHITDQKSIKENLGAVFDTTFFVPEWTIHDVENAIKPFYKSWDSKKYIEMINKFGLASNKKVKDLSRGMQMKLMIACALSHDAKLLILDEPTSGLDPVSRDELLDILSSFIEDGNRSVLFSTHITTDLEKIADYITFIHKGKMFYTGTKDEFIEGFKIVKGGENELTKSMKEHIIGLRKYSSGFEALIKTDNSKYFNELCVEPATIDEIIVFTSKEVN